MRVLLDESLPRRLKHELAEHEVDLCVIILLARSNDIADLRPLAPALRSAVAEAIAGRVVTVEA